MEPVTESKLRSFFERLGEQCAAPAAIYLLGGSALCLLGSPRVTVDVDCALEAAVDYIAALRVTLAELASEMQLDVEEVPLDEFIPLPPQARGRRRAIGRFGRLDVYIFDPYSIALSKIARGFEADIEDVLFMLRKGLIQFDELQHHFVHILPQAPEADIVPEEFEAYFDEVRRRTANDPSKPG